VIDINGYYAGVSSTNTLDFLSVIGSYASDGGLLYVVNTSAIGAAVRAINGGTDVRLAQGANAIDVASGTLRIRGASNNSNTMAFVHNVTANNSCVSGGFN